MIKYIFVNMNLFSYIEYCYMKKKFEKINCIFVFVVLYDSNI